MTEGRSITSSALGGAWVLLLALTLVVTPVICCCFGAQGQAMAATMPAMDMEDCDAHGSGESSSKQYENTKDKEAGCGNVDCSGANAFDSIKIDLFVTALPLHADTFILVNDIETIVEPMATRIAAINPHRGPPLVVPTTLVSLNILLLI